jgi:hypothetical protein
MTPFREEQIVTNSDFGTIWIQIPKMDYFLKLFEYKSQKSITFENDTDLRK